MIGRREHFRSLDALRGIAAVMVVWFHSAFVNGSRPALVAPGNLYVDFFFALSGFVITHAYVSRIDDGLSFRSFFWARLARIWPLHLAMSLLFLVYVLLQNLLFNHFGIGSEPSENNSLWSFLCNILMIHALGILDGLSWNYPSWSISVEFYTYLIFYLFILSTGALRLPLALCLCVFSYSALIVISVKLDRETILASYDFGLVRGMAGFFGGYITYQITRVMRRQKVSRVGYLQIVSVGLTLTCLYHADNSRIFELLTILSFLPTIAILAMSDGPLTRLLERPVLQWLGQISYSIYLTHAIILAVITFALRSFFSLEMIAGENGRAVIDTVWATPINLTLIGLVTAVATLTYRYIEKPAQSALLRWSKSRRETVRC